MHSVSGQDDDRRTALGICSRLFERVTRLLIIFLERNPSILMPHLPELLSMYVEAGILRVSAAEIQRMRPKRAFLMLRLLCLSLMSADRFQRPSETFPFSIYSPLKAAAS